MGVVEFRHQTTSISQSDLNICCRLGGIQGNRGRGSGSSGHGRDRGRARVGHDFRGKSEWTEQAVYEKRADIVSSTLYFDTA